MRTLSVPRHYWTAPELRKRYGLDDDAFDLRRAIVAELFHPAMWLSRADMLPVQISDGTPVTSSEELASVDGWFYFPQRFAWQSGTFNWQYPIACDRPELSEDSRLYAFPAEPISLDWVMQFGVVFDEELMRAEAAQRSDPERALSTKEERTRDRLIVALTMEHYGWEPHSERSDGVARIVRACEATGFPLTANTVKTHLKLAWERSTPKLS